MWQLPSPLQTIAPLHHTMPQREEPTAVNPSSPHVMHCFVTADVRDRAQAHVVLEKNKNKQAVPAFAWTSTRARGPFRRPVCTRSATQRWCASEGKAIVKRQLCWIALQQLPNMFASVLRVNLSCVNIACADGHTALNAPDLFLFDLRS